MGRVVPPAAHAPLWRTLGRQTCLVAETCPLFSPLFATWLHGRLGPHSGVMEGWKKLGRVRTMVGETRLVVGPEEGWKSTTQIHVSRKKAELELNLSHLFAPVGNSSLWGTVQRPWFVGGKLVVLSGPLQRGTASHPTARNLRHRSGNRAPINEHHEGYGEEKQSSRKS